MINFDDFVKELGPDANRFTSDELRQLHKGVQVIAETLFAIHQACQRASEKSTPAGVDGGTTDRTLRSELTEGVESHP